jgi:hypothetical protein
VTETRELQWQEKDLREVVRGPWLVAGEGKAELGTQNAKPETRNSPTVLFSGELTLRDAEGLRVPISFQHFNPIEVIGNPDEWTRVRTVRVRAATLNDLAPLHASFGSGHLVVKIIRRKE